MTTNRILELKAAAAKTGDANLNEALDEIMRLRRVCGELGRCLDAATRVTQEAIDTKYGKPRG